MIEFNKTGQNTNFLNELHGNMYNSVYISVNKNNFKNASCVSKVKNIGWRLSGLFLSLSSILLTACEKLAGEMRNHALNAMGSIMKDMIKV